MKQSVVRLLAVIFLLGIVTPCITGENSYAEEKFEQNYSDKEKNLNTESTSSSTESESNYSSTVSSDESDNSNFEEQDSSVDTFDDSSSVIAEESPLMGRKLNDKDVGSIITPGISTFLADKKIQNFPGIKMDYTGKIDSNYSFFIQPTKKTKWFINGTDSSPLIETGGSNSNNQYPDIAKGKTIIYIDSANVPGTLRVTNVGYYKGEEIDLLIDVTYINLKNYSSILWGKVPSKIAIGAGEDNFLDVYMSGDTSTEINLAYTTVKTNSNEKIKTSGIVPMDYISKRKSSFVQLDQVSQLYALSSSVVLYDDTNSAPVINNGQKAVAFYTKSNDDLGQKSQVIQLYKDLYTRNSGVVLNNAETGIVTKFSGDIPIDIDPPFPVITEDYLGKSFENNLIVKQYIPMQPNASKISKYSMTILIPDILKIDLESIKVNDSQENDITTLFSKKLVDTDNPNIKSLQVTLNSDEILLNLERDGPIYNNYQIITIPTQLDYNKDYSSYEDLMKKQVLVPTNGVVLDIGKGQYLSSVSTGLVSFTNQSQVIVNYLDNNDNEVYKSDIYSNRIGDSYEYHYLENIPGYKPTESTVANPLVKGVQTPQQVVHNFTYDDQRFSNTFLVSGGTPFLTKGVIFKGDEIKVQLLIKNDEKVELNNLTEGAVEISYDKSILKSPKNIMITDKLGKQIGSAVYDESSDKIRATLPPNSSVDNDYIVNFQFQVREDTIELIDLLTFQATINMKFTDSKPAYNSSISSDTFQVKSVGDVTLNVPSELYCSSIPIEKTDVDEKLKYNEKDNLELYDTSGVFDNWQITVKLDDKGLIGTKSNKTAPLHLHYRDSFKDIIIAPEKSIEIFSSKDYKKYTEYNLNKIWGSNEEYGFSIQGTASGMPIDSYEGNLIWTFSMTE